MGVVATSSPHRGRRPLVLLVTCSARKRIPIHPQLQLRSISSGDPLARLEEWKSRLVSVEAASVPAVALYAGDHWSAARLAIDHARAWNPKSQLWVMSAGYGIVAGEVLVKSYSATFARGQDSVFRRGSTDDRRGVISAWWKGLPHESTVENLLSDPSEPVMLIAGGSDYIEALRVEIEAAAADANRLNRLFVISAGSRDIAGLLPVRGSHSGAVGGSLASLNARILAYLMRSANEHGFARPEMEAMLRSLDGSAACVTARASASDGEIMSAISALRAGRPALSYTSALRALRSQDLACERLRFKALWLQATASG